jgi:hypothetical protein
MMDALESVLPIATAIALSPLPIVGIVLIAGSPRARVAGPMYLLGWVLGLTALAAAAAVAVHLVGDIGPTGTILLDWLRVLLGGLLLWAAVAKWRSRPGETEEPVTPKWLGAFRQISPVAAMRWGAALAVLNFKHIGLVVAAMAALAYVPLLAGEAVLLTLLLIALSSVTITSVVLVQLFAPEQATSYLKSIERFLLQHNDVIIIVVLVIMGMAVLGEGLSGLVN